MNRLFYISVLFLGMISTGCNKVPSELAPADLVKWVEDPENGLRITRTSDNFKFTVQYRPYEYIVAMKERTNTLSQSDLDKNLEELEGMQYYVLKIESKNGQDILQANISTDEESDYRLNYCTSVISKDLFLISDNDTVACAFCHFERNYGLRNHNNFVFAFAVDDHSAVDREVVFIDNGFSRQMLRFKFRSDDIKKTPKIITN